MEISGTSAFGAPGIGTAAAEPAHGKWEVYIWLQAKLGLDERQTHIGQFSEWMCDEVVRLCRQASAPPAAGQAAA